MASIVTPYNDCNAAVLPTHREPMVLADGADLFITICLHEALPAQMRVFVLSGKACSWWLARNWSTLRQKSHFLNLIVSSVRVKSSLFKLTDLSW